ncbi:MAG: DUF86 domain-containing protein [Candidatus Desantisbacteria bacterium]
MSNKDREAKLFIADVLEAIQKIENYTHKMSYEEFMKDERTKDAVLRNLEVIGEAVKNIPNEIKEKYLKVDWKAISGMRDRLIHGYFGVSFPIIWETVTDELPTFKENIEEVLKEMG